MKAFSRIYLAAALAGLPIGSLAALSTDAQPSSPRVAAQDAALAQITPRQPAESAIDTQKLGSVLGIEVRTNTEHNIGRIVDLLANPSGQVEAAVIEFGGFLGMGTRKIAIEWPALRLETSDKRTVAVLDMTRDQLRTAPEYKPEQPVVVRRIVPPPPTPPTETAAPEEPTTQPPPQKKAPSTKRTRRHHTRERY